MYSYPSTIYCIRRATTVGMYYLVVVLVLRLLLIGCTMSVLVSGWPDQLPGAGVYWLVVRAPIRSCLGGVLVRGSRLVGRTGSRVCFVRRRFA